MWWRGQEVTADQVRVIGDVISNYRTLGLGLHSPPRLNSARRMGHRASQSCSKTNSHAQTLRERISKTEKTPSVKRSFINKLLSRRCLLGFKLKKVWLTKTNTSRVYQGLSSSNEDLSSWKRASARNPDDQNIRKKPKRRSKVSPCFEITVFTIQCCYLY